MKIEELNISNKILSNLNNYEYSYLSDIFLKYNGYPSLEQIWKLMDKAWNECRCDEKVFDNRIVDFYMHPIWLLNTIFIEQDEESLNHRRVFAKWVYTLQPKRIADIGGGGGTLARMIAEYCPDTQIEIIEPYPHKALMISSDRTINLTYKNELNGNYDLLIATDVFEHVIDPVSLLNNTLKHLKTDGAYLIANCFWPVIKCHLSQNFHLRYSWELICKNMGLENIETVQYGNAYTYNGKSNFINTKKIESKSIFMYKFFDKLPNRFHGYFQNLFF
jgi:2-polyprenyl-3-methyl-5-hydroxy-6-metoxy-1,4-benzoquinol methylase